MINYGTRQNQKTKQNINIFRKMARHFRKSIASFNNLFWNIFNYCFVYFIHTNNLFKKLGCSRKNLFASHETYCLNTSELDNYSTNIDSNILPSDISVDRRNNRNKYKMGRCEEEFNRGTDRKQKISNTKHGKGIIKMPIFTINPHESVQLSFNINRRKPSIYYKIEATHKIRVYLLDEEGLHNLEQEISIDSYNSITSPRKYHEEDIPLPFNGKWYLIVYNPNKEVVSVHYEAYT